MARSGLFVDPVPGTPPVGTAAIDARLAMAGLLGTSPALIKGGNVTTSGANMNITVAASSWFLPDSTNALAMYLSATDSTTLTPAAGPGTGSRVDILVVKQNNYANGDADSRVNISLVAGTPGAPGVAPAVPTGAMLFATITVPTSASNSSACTIAVNNQSIVLPPMIRTGTKGLLDNFAVTGYFNPHTGQQAYIYNDGPNNGIWFWSLGGTWRRDSSVTQSPGLVAIIPPSVAGSGVSLGAGGKVTYTGATTIGINGCFTGDFDNYLVIIDNASKSAASNITLNMRLSGTNAVTSAYSWVRGYDTTTARTVASGTSTSVEIEAGTQGRSDIKVDLFSPNIATPTGIDARSVALPYRADTGCAHTPSTAYDGFALTPTSGTMTGVLRIYGYNDNE